MATVDSLRPTLEERLGVAISSQNLTLKEFGCPVDKIIALGIAARENDLADPIIALRYANDRRAYPTLLRAMRTVVHRTNKDRRLERRLERIAKSVLDYWLNDLCEPCTGIGFQAIEGSPIRAGKVCSACHGEGKRPKPWIQPSPKVPRNPKDEKAMEAYQKAIERKLSFERFHRRLLVELDRAERKVLVRVRRLLR